MASPSTSPGVTVMSPLEQELLAVEGVRNAHVRITERGPTGVRVVLADDADRARVAADIHRLLEDRGLSTLIDPGPVAPEPSHGPAGLPEVPPPPAPFPARSTARTETDEEPATAPQPLPSLIVGVEDAGRSCRVTVQSAGRSATRQSAVNPESIRTAALGALWEILERTEPLPEIVSVTIGSAAHRSMLTVVLDDQSSIGVGSALIGATKLRAFVEAARLAIASF